MNASAHPDRLLWYVSGRIEPEEARTVRIHLETCDDCRGEVQSLASMRRSLRRPAGSDHPPVIDLVDCAARRRALEPQRPAAIETHVRACAACLQELGHLDDARPAIEEVRRGRAARRWAVAACAGALLILSSWAWRAWTRPPQVPEIFLAPSVRGGDRPALPAGRGPWPLIVALPFDAPDGECLLELQAEDGADVPGVPPSAPRSNDGTLEVELRSLPGPGEYKLVVTVSRGGPVARYLYPFRLGGAPRPSPPASIP